MKLTPYFDNEKGLQVQDPLGASVITTKAKKKM
jgi:hypothetical protein